MLPINPFQFRDGIGVFVDPQIAVAVVAPGVAAARADDEEGGGLHPAPIASGGLPRLQGREKALRERAGALLEGRRHGLDDLARGENVALHRAVSCDTPARPVVAFVAGVGRGPARGVDDPDLAAFSQGVGGEELREAFARSRPLAEGIEGERSEADVGVGLGGDRTDSRFGVGDDAAHGDDARLHRHPEVSGFRVEGDDGIGPDVRGITRAPGSGTAAEEKESGAEEEKVRFHRVAKWCLRRAVPSIGWRRGVMAKGKDEHQAREVLLQSFGKDLARRAKSKCELCERSGRLAVFELPPAPREPDFDRCLLLCEDCLAAAANPRRFQPGEAWRFLANQAWSEIPMVQVLAVRLLRRQADTQAWAREALSYLELDETVEALVTEGE